MPPKINKEKSYFIIVILISFIMFLSILFAYLQEVKRHIKNDYAYKQTLMKLYGYNEDLNTIFLHSYREIDNDKASKVIKKFDKILLLLNKADLIEDFKTLNVRIINASYYLETLQKKIIKERSDKDIQALIRKISFTLGQVFIGKVLDISLFNRHLITLEKYKHHSKSIQSFYMHSTKLTEDILLLQEVLKESKRLGLRKVIYEMHQVLRVENTNNKSKENIISMVFFFFSFVGMLVLIYLYLRILSQKEEMHRLAYHDSLTNLPNRLQFEEYINTLLLSNKKQQKEFMLLFIDLDRFKVINDSLGHDVGDEILIQVSKRLRGILGKDNFISRLGGDEFIAILEEKNHLEKIENILDLLIVEIRKPLLIREYSLNTTASIGIVKYPEDGKDKHTLLKYADSAMYAAKDKGKDTYAFYNTQLSVDMHRRLVLEQELVFALKEEEFSLVYQPQYALNSGKITGVEALVRWKNPVLGQVSPEEFISIAEDIGLIIELGYYIFKEACLAYMDWKRQGVDIEFIAINISSVQLRRHDTFEAFMKIIKETGIDPHHIEIELTERYIMEYTIEKLTILDKLRAIGCQVSIDDFGTGYSSMSYLKSLAIDTIKIDKSFVLDLPDNKHDVEVSKAIIVLSQTLGYKVIAEGIETEAQEALLSNYNCDMGQGYYFSKPISSEEIVKFYYQNEKVR
ncbi:diguanylate cyclase/phosphodiesterase (GGDEF & EAL domains) with PAS/PAC sensor(s) [hydrothermal vent metagenome]|uniref:Diguanylate cyclase/phosphodiesterase (GGDEF & EAL domains) with PAS/PAC sensor(S) n=1 Tax=hydrothermal vent metagenome TaxID=652676 RepID=A0A1W1CI74_9ZZZZ